MRVFTAVTKISAVMHNKSRFSLFLRSLFLALIIPFTEEDKLGHYKDLSERLKMIPYRFNSVHLGPSFFA